MMAPSVSDTRTPSTSSSARTPSSSMRAAPMKKVQLFRVRAWGNLTKLRKGHAYKEHPKANDELLSMIQLVLREKRTQDAMALLWQIERELNPHCDTEYRLTRSRSRRGNPEHVAQDAQKDKKIE